MSSPREPSAPPPVIGKIGPYTVFLTPPTTTTSTVSATATATATTAVVDSPKKVAVHAPPPPVQPPPAQFYEPSNDRFGFLRDALTKVQNGKRRCDKRGFEQETNCLKLSSMSGSIWNEDRTPFNCNIY